MFSTLALGFATVALALEGGDELEASNEMIATTNAQTEIVYTPGAPPPAIVPEADRRRLRVTKEWIRDLLDLNLCTNGPWAIHKVLSDAVRDVMRKNLKPWEMKRCSVIKRIILPSLRKCVLKSTGVDHTLYAGATVDGQLVGVHLAGVIGAYVDSDGVEGCFTTRCSGLGVPNVQVGAGGVAGVLFGNGKSDFPGTGYGGEVGGDIGPGLDFAGGATTGYKPYAEISGGVGIGFTLGVNACQTTTWN